MQPDPQSDLDAMVADLRAQLDEDERLARAAVIPAHEGPNAYKPHPELASWRYVPGGEVEYVSTPEMERQEYAETYRVTCDSEGLSPAVNDSVGPHIARQDPARVLALVAAHREILELYESTTTRLRAASAAVQGDDDLSQVGLVRQLAAHEALRQVVSRLAAAYADRDDEGGRPNAA